VAKEIFQILQRCVAEALVLVLPDFNKVFELACDASGLVHGAILRKAILWHTILKNLMNQRKNIALMIKNYMQLKNTIYV